VVLGNLLLKFQYQKNFHSHFSRIEFTKGGEKKHWTYCDSEYGPNFEPLAKMLIKKDLEPTIICESRGTMAEDALSLKQIYEALK
jgi:deoxyribonuclease-4